MREERIGERKGCERRGEGISGAVRQSKRRTRVAVTPTDGGPVRQRHRGRRQNQVKKRGGRREVLVHTHIVTFVWLYELAKSLPVHLVKLPQEKLDVVAVLDWRFFFPVCLHRT